MKVQSIILASFYVLSVYSAGTVRTVKPALKPVVKPGTPPVVPGIHPTRPTVPTGAKPGAKPIPKGTFKPVSKIPTPPKTNFGMNVEQLANANREFTAFIDKLPKNLSKNEIIDFLNSRITALNGVAPKVTPAPKPVTTDPKPVTGPKAPAPKLVLAKPSVKPLPKA